MLFVYSTGHENPTADPTRALPTFLYTFPTEPLFCDRTFIRRKLDIEPGRPARVPILELQGTVLYEGSPSPPFTLCSVWVTHAAARHPRVSSCAAAKNAESSVCARPDHCAHATRQLHVAMPARARTLHTCPLSTIPSPLGQGTVFAIPTPATHRDHRNCSAGKIGTQESGCATDSVQGMRTR